MKFAGLLLRESLNDSSILDLIQITKTETWNVGNAADSQSEIWTAISFEGERLYTQRGKTLRENICRLCRYFILQ